MKNRILATLAVAILLAIALYGIKHIDGLNDGIKLEQIKLQDNSVRLKLLDDKYTELNKQLESKDSDKAKVEEQLKELQKERETLQAQLQAKLRAKEQDIAAKAAEAVTGTQKAYAATGSCKDWISQAGISDVESAYTLMMRESSCNPGTANSINCIGLGQNCPDQNGYYWLKEACPNWQNDPVCQMKRFNTYAISRYGSWSAALAFSYANNWY